jgi:hypothetical protein
MNPIPNPTRYFRQGAIKRSDLCTTLAPKPVRDAVAKLADAIEARQGAESAWGTLMASAYPKETEVKRASDALDASRKTAESLARDYARAVVESRDEWAAAIDDGIEGKVAELDRLLAAAEAALAELDTLKSVRQIPVRTIAKVPERYNRRVTSKPAKDAIGEVKRWLHPPVERRSPVRARNFGPGLMSREALEFVGPED